MTDFRKDVPESRTVVNGIWSDILDDWSSAFDNRLPVRLGVSTLDSFSSSGAAGRAFAKTIPLTLSANDTHSLFIEKNANIAVRFVRAKGLYIEAVSGNVSGTILSIDEFISTNGILSDGFFGSIETYSGATVGDVVLGASDELTDSFYPDGTFVVQLRNESESSITTFLSIGVEQISDAGVYSVLLPTTQLESSTEMSDYNGAS